MMIANRGDDLTVGSLPADGTFPTATTQYEKRSIADDIPIWDPQICTQCGLCSLGCPHATIRMKAFDPGCWPRLRKVFDRPTTRARNSPAGSLSCGGSPTIAPAAACASKSARPRTRRRSNTRRSTWSRSCALGPRGHHVRLLHDHSRRGPVASQGGHDQGLATLAAAVRVLRRRLAACGETPYIKLLTQFFGDRMLIGNATGCSSIYGGNLPCTPYTVNREGRGPSWSNSLFEDLPVRPGLPPGGGSTTQICPGTAQAAVVAVGR